VLVFVLRPRLGAAQRFCFGALTGNRIQTRRHLHYSISPPRCMHDSLMHTLFRQTQANLHARINNQVHAKRGNREKHRNKQINEEEQRTSRLSAAHCGAAGNDVRRSNRRSRMLHMSTTQDTHRRINTDTHIHIFANTQTQTNTPTHKHTRIQVHIHHSRDQTRKSKHAISITHQVYSQASPKYWSPLLSMRVPAALGILRHRQRPCCCAQHILA
jgi:hypothetical protein